MEATGEVEASQVRNRLELAVQEPRIEGRRVSGKPWRRRNMVVVAALKLADMLEGGIAQLEVALVPYPR